MIGTEDSVSHSHCSVHISFLMQHEGVALVEFYHMIEAVVVGGAVAVVMKNEVGLFYGLFVKEVYKDVLPSAGGPL